MSEAQPRRLLVVANLTESTPQLLKEVEGAKAGCSVTLIVPPEHHPDAPDWSPEDAKDLVQRSAHGRPVQVVDAGADAAATISGLVREAPATRSSCARRPSTTRTGTVTTSRRRSRSSGFP